MKGAQVLGVQQTAQKRKEERAIISDYWKTHFPNATYKQIDELIKKVDMAKQLVDFCQEKLTKTEKDIEKIIEDK